MRLYNRINAIKRINQLAGKGVPFVFLINSTVEYTHTPCRTDLGP